MHEELTVAHVEGHRSRRERDRIGVDHLRHFALLAGPNLEDPRLDRERRRQDHLRDGEVREHDLLRKPRQVEEVARREVDRDRLFIEYAQVRDDGDDRGTRERAVGHEHRGVVTREEEPGSVERRKEHDRSPHRFCPPLFPRTPASIERAIALAECPPTLSTASRTGTATLSPHGDYGTPIRHNQELCVRHKHPLMHAFQHDHRKSCEPRAGSGIDRDHDCGVHLASLHTNA